MRTRSAGNLLLAVLVAIVPALARAEQPLVVAVALADDAGECAVDLLVDPATDPRRVADDLQQNILFTGGATARSISVENGVAHIECANARPGSVVEVWLPGPVASSMGAAGEPPEGAVSTGSILGGVLLAAVGLGVGLCVALGCFDDDDGPRNVPGTR